MRDIRLWSTGAVLAVLWVGLSAARLPAPPAPPPIAAFVTAAGSDDRAARRALAEIRAGWRNGYAAILVDLARLLPSPRRATQPNDPTPTAGDDPQGPGLVRQDAGAPPGRSPGEAARQRLTAFLEQQTGQRFGDDLRAWRRWMWTVQEPLHPEYAQFKGDLYARLDPRFRAFFPPAVTAAIRLDEIDWGGVAVNGIPPLRAPATIPAASATWLRDTNVVFGIEVNGEARAYPKRILAWHEMAIDRLGGVELTIVYCTLCGTVIPYESGIDGRHFTFGTSGLLYRSNKLMFDEESGSLWSALDGVPVVGPLVGRGLRLRFRSVVTTTWGAWKRGHPSTTVLSIDTGFDRDYAEGAAYRDYFATDRLMFEVPARDARLKNKAEVLVLRGELIGHGSAPIAIAVDRLRRAAVFNVEAGGRHFVVVTTEDGANRLYEAGSRRFVGRDPAGIVRDASGGRWHTETDALVSDGGERQPQIPTHRAFWFGWYAQHPDTVLYR